MTSTSTWGYPDLDLRPAEMKRSSMFAWLQECPHCGFVARDIEQTHVKVAPDFLKSEEYLPVKVMISNQTWPKDFIGII